MEAAFFLMLPTTVLPSPRSLLMLPPIGVFAAGGQICLTYAYQTAPASQVSIYDYAGIVISMLLGSFVFKAPITPASALGSILITCGALWSYLYNRRHGKK